MSGKRGRPINEELLETMVAELGRKPRTIKSLAEALEVSRRTAYRYIDLLVAKGVPIVKLGMAKDAPYFVMRRGKGKNTKIK